VSVDGLEGRFNRFSFGVNFALYEMDLSGKNTISYIGNFANKRSRLTDSLG